MRMKNRRGQRRLYRRKSLIQEIYKAEQIRKMGVSRAIFPDRPCPIGLGEPISRTRIHLRSDPSRRRHAFSVRLETGRWIMERYT